MRWGLPIGVAIKRDGVKPARPSDRRPSVSAVSGKKTEESINPIILSLPINNYLNYLLNNCYVPSAVSDVRKRQSASP